MKFYSAMYQALKINSLIYNQIIFGIECDIYNSVSQHKEILTWQFCTHVEFPRPDMTDEEPKLLSLLNMFNFNRRKSWQNRQKPQ